MYTICNDVINRINLDNFRNLLREHQLRVSGNKFEVIRRIKESINGQILNSTLTVEKLDQFLAEEIAHGRNRSIFISYFHPSCSVNLANPDFVREALTRKELHTENFNNLRTVERPEETKLVYLNIIEEQEECVAKISMCFAMKVEVEVEVGDGLTDQRVATDYIWVDIIPSEDTMMVRIWPKHNDYRDISTKIVCDEISKFVRRLFSITSINMEDSKNTLYKIFKELTHTAEQPFKARVEPLKETIEEFANKCATELAIPNPTTPINLPYRVFRLLERALIQQEFSTYESYFEGKRGIVRRIYFSDLTGASVNARSSYLNEGIAVADIYFDTRDTIEEMQRLEKVWVEWFYVPDPENPAERIETRLEVFKDYLVIHFLYAYLNKEVVEVVLSNFKYYESLPSR